MKALSLILSLASAIGLAGCANQPSTPDIATPVPADRVYLSQPPAPVTGTIQILRDTGMSGSGCVIDVFINHQRAASLEPGEAVTFSVPPGRTLIEAATNGLMCSGRDSEVMAISPDQTYYFRTAADGAFSVTLSPTIF